MINDKSNDYVLNTFNRIIGNPQTIIIQDNDYAYNLALKRNKLGGIPRSDKGGYKNLTICDEYIWESLLFSSNYDILFVTRDETYLENEELLKVEYKEKTGKKLRFYKYVSEALNEFGETVSQEAIEKEQNEQEEIIINSRIQDITGLDDESLDSALLSLTMKEEIIIKQRFGLDGQKPKTLEEIAREYNMSIDSIRRIEAKAIRKLKSRNIYGGRQGNIVLKL